LNEDRVTPWRMLTWLRGGAVNVPQSSADQCPRLSVFHRTAEGHAGRDRQRASYPLQCLSIFLAGHLLTLASASFAAEAGTHWSYSGATGPEK